MAERCPCSPLTCPQPPPHTTPHLSNTSPAPAASPALLPETFFHTEAEVLQGCDTLGIRHAVPGGHRPGNGHMEQGGGVTAGEVQWVRKVRRPTRGMHGTQQLRVLT